MKYEFINILSGQYKISIVKQIGKVSEIESDLISIINNLYNSDDINQKKSAMNLLIFLYKDLNKNNKRYNTYRLSERFIYSPSL